MVRNPVIRLGVSSCLLGEEVRFDGGHKRHAFLVNILGRHVEWAPKSLASATRLRPFRTRQRREACGPGTEVPGSTPSLLRSARAVCDGPCVTRH